MKDFEKELMSVVDDYVTDYSAEELFEEFFPGASIGEIIVDIYNAGLIPSDVLERFLDE